MKEFIDRSVALGALHKVVHVTPTQCDTVSDCMTLIKDVPTADVVEVVRCKECKHLVFSDCYGECGKAYLGIVQPYDFCSRGERRESNER